MGTTLVSIWTLLTFMKFLHSSSALKGDTTKVVLWPKSILDRIELNLNTQAFKSINGFFATYERTCDISLDLSPHVNQIPFQSMEVHYIPESINSQDVDSSWATIVHAAFDDMTQLPGLHLRIDNATTGDLKIDSVMPWLEQLYGNHTILTNVAHFPTFAPVDHQLFRDLKISSAFSSSIKEESHEWKAWMYLTQSMLPSSKRYPFPSYFGTIRDIPGINCFDDQELLSQGDHLDDWTPIMSSHAIHCSDEVKCTITVQDMGMTMKKSIRLEAEALTSPQSTELIYVDSIDDHGIHYKKFPHDESESVKAMTMTPTPHHDFPQVDAWIETEGFHQNIHINISRSKSLEKCHKFLVLQVVTQDMFADLDQLQQLSRFHTWTLLPTFSPHIDIEKPSYLSGQHVILFQSSIDPDYHEEDMTLSYPIHFRYQSPTKDDGTKYTLLSIPPPLVWFQCQGSSDTIWHRGTFSRDFSFDNFSVSFPVGIQDDRRIVEMLTFGITVIGSISVILFTLMYPRSTMSAKKNL